MHEDKQLVQDAITAYRQAHGITGDDRIHVAVPSDDIWRAWAHGYGMGGEPRIACVAVRVAGWGTFYPTPAHAIDDLDHYFMAEDEPHHGLLTRPQGDDDDDCPAHR